MLISDAIRVGIAGELYYAPPATTGPTDSTTPLPGTWTGTGSVSEDGVEEAYNDDTTDIKRWQNGTIVRTVITGSKASLHLTLIETKKTVLELFHKGSTVATTAPGKYKLAVKPATADRRSFVLDVVDADQFLRIYVPSGEVSERGTITYDGGDVVGYEVTITCYPATVGSEEVLLVKYSDDAFFGSS